MKRLLALVAVAAFTSIFIAAVDPGVVITANKVVGADTITTQTYAADWEQIAIIPIAKNQAGSDTNYVVMVFISGIAQLSRGEQLSIIVASAGIRGDTFLHQPDSAQQRWDVRASPYLRGPQPYEVPFNFMYTVLDSNTTNDTIKVSAAVIGGSQVELEDVQVSFMALRQ